MAVIYPGETWERVTPSEAGFDPVKLEAARRWQGARKQDERYSAYRTVIVRGGHIVAEWYNGLDRDYHARLASATKSIFSSILGIAIADAAL